MPSRLAQLLRRAGSRTAGRAQPCNPTGPGPLERRWRERARFWLRGRWSDAVVAERLQPLGGSPWPSTGRLLDSGPLPELFSGQFGERVKAEWLPWVRAAAEGASPDQLRALEPPGFVAGEPMTMLEPVDPSPIVDRDPGDETGIG